MTVNVPQAGGVPGIPGPPDWIAGDNHLDDVRWRGATQRAFGSGASNSAVFRAVQVPSSGAGLAGQHDLYLSFRASFVETLNTALDYVYLGLQKKGSSAALLVQIQAHGPAFTSVGPPSPNPPGNVLSALIYTWDGTRWTPAGGAAAPTWVGATARLWLQNNTDFPSDPNYRWAVQLKIPGSVAASITDNAGPNLGDDLLVWYLLRASLSNGAAVILGEDRIDGMSTSNFNLVTGSFPGPSGTVWDEFLLTTGPASFGGVALNWGDVLVHNAAYGDGWTIANGQSNTFIARPRNYQPAGNDIPAGGINATFRIANWGSVAGDPTQPNFATGVWDYVPGNDAVTPVNSNAVIPTLAAGANPPATSPIALAATMNLAAGKSLHQCVLVTMSGANLTFLNDSIFQNMNYDHSSLLERPAEISIVGLTPISPRPRDVYLAIEKINMRRDTPGTNEGQFLAASMQRLIAQGGPLADKLKQVQGSLSEGDYGSSARLEQILDDLRSSLAELNYGDRAGSGVEYVLERLISASSNWLSRVKAQEGDQAQRLAVVFDALADWLSASVADAPARRSAFASQLGSWLRGIANDPASRDLTPAVGSAVTEWLQILTGSEALIAPLSTIQRWAASGAPAAQEPAVADALGQILTLASTNNPTVGAIIANFALGTALWLRGGERLPAFIDSLNNAGLNDTELDQLFPTFRVHPYYDTGETFVGTDGLTHPVLRAQSSFGIYAYHEGAVDGWQTSLQGARRIAQNLYLLAVPNNGTTSITTRIQAVGPGEQRIPDDPIEPIPPPPPPPLGCLGLLFAAIRWLLRKLGL